MKLRYFHLQDRPPLQDISITFDQSDILERVCAIHFVVGVNGSGVHRAIPKRVRPWKKAARSYSHPKPTRSQRVPLANW